MNPVAGNDIITIPFKKSNFPVYGILRMSAHWFIELLASKFKIEQY